MISAQYGNPYPKSRLEVICPFNNVYMTGDGKYIAMCDPEYDRDYNKIMGLIGRDDLIDDPKYVNCVKMNEANLNAEVVGIMDEALAKMTSEEALKLFKDAGIPIEPCQTPLDVYEDQNVWDNGQLYASWLRSLCHQPTSASSFRRQAPLPLHHIHLPSIP